MRAVRLVTTVALLAVTYLASWIAIEHGERGPVGIAEPREGERVTVTLYEVGEVDGDSRFWLRRGALGIWVAGSTDELSVGDELTVHGVVHDGVLHEEWRALAPLRWAKKALGFLGLAVAAGLAAGSLRWTRGGWDLRG